MYTWALQFSLQFCSRFVVTEMHLVSSKESSNFRSLGRQPTTTHLFHFGGQPKPSPSQIAYVQRDKNRKYICIEIGSL